MKKFGRLFLWNRAVHRDVGYLCVGLILIYAVSGIAVNHISDWNASYRNERETRVIGGLPSKSTSEFEPALVAELGISAPLLSRVDDPHEGTLLFYDGIKVGWREESQTVSIERTSRRFGIFMANFLHLNEAKRAWTYVADIFAAALAYLAISGPFMVKGKKGFWARGWALVLVSFSIPLAFFLFYAS